LLLVRAATAYGELAEQLVAGIAGGDYPIGSRLPTESDLCASTGLSRNTVRRALQELTDAGMISRRPGDGSRVMALSPVDDYQPVAGTTDDIVRLVQRTKIVHPAVREVTADAALARRLGCRRGTRWNLMEGLRVRRGSAEPPLCWSEQYLLAGRPGFDVLTSGEFAASDADRLDIEQTVSAEILAPEMAAKLQSDSGAALVVARRKRDAEGRLVTVGIHTHPADRYQLTTRIARSS
jgi:DNA-binding GntR family transcriptional regulator